MEPPGRSATNLTSGSSPKSALATMTEPLAKEEQDKTHAVSALWSAFTVNLILGSVKLFAWSISGSPSVFSESLHSFGDSVNSIALILGNKFSQRPADRTHPFGYGLEANVWALAACVFLLFTSSWAIWEGVHHLTTPDKTGLDAHNTEGLYWSVGILALSILLESYAVHRASTAVVSELNLSAGNPLNCVYLAVKNIKNVISPTTRFIFYEDFIALGGAMLALVAVLASYFAVQWSLLPAHISHWPDAIASIGIGVLLLVMAVYLFRHNRGILTQTAAPPKIEKRIRDIVTSLTGVSEVLDLKTVDHGIAGLNVHLQVEVDPYIQVKDVDDLTERIKEVIQERIKQVRQVFVEVLADESEIEWTEKFYTLIAQGRKEGVLDAREEVLLKNVYEFTEITVEDIMIPRRDVDYVDIQSSLSHVADRIIESGFSRLPVFKETVDNLVGIVHARDVYEKIHHNQGNTPLADIVREIDIYPENKPVSDLLEEFKRNKIRVAAVADEHGGFAGLVTIQDVIEEIIGELWDEHDEEEAPMYTLLSANEVMMSGKWEIEALNAVLTLNLPFDNFKTIGGFLFGELGREPEEGDEIVFEELQFRVEKVEGPRIVTVYLKAPSAIEVNTDHVL